MGAVILVGDFNSDPTYTNSGILPFLDDPEIGCAIKVLTPHNGTYNTYPSNAPKERLNYIFFTAQNFDLIEAQILSSFETISDHLPIFAKPKWKLSK